MQRQADSAKKRRLRQGRIAQRRWRKKHPTEKKKNNHDYHKKKKHDMTYIIRRNKNKEEWYHQFAGHVRVIYQAIKRYAKAWKLPICGEQEFVDWAIRDPDYNAFHDDWKGSLYANKLGPVVMRKTKRNGFVIANLKWDYKGRYAWWNESRELIKELHDELEAIRDIENKGTPEKNKTRLEKVRAIWKLRKGVAK